ncbi:hypothetical protein JKJ11_15130 [Vibrio sp. SCSIO 43133]|uniref:hypothetical protein n=1 Tax=Vibrio sp. SCSIO 43133 TaxID=2802577 RepID=UPI002074F47C|nr:hypothetical protein [Vibrio sp. SCSIO 43133]USE00239.1 hypothetical protein JKJ11_15130 [Vibrio sp. SCSIO 43133]
MRFSEYFQLSKTQPYLDFVDIPLDTDVPVFLDPSSIRALESTWGNELSSLLQTFFQSVLDNIRKGDHVKAKALLASLNERNEFHLGYSHGKSRGHGFGKESANLVWNALTQSKAAKTGLIKDLEDTALMINGIGTDMISDAVCNILRGPLIKYTQDVCNYYGISLQHDVPSGPIWNPATEMWEESYVSLPMTPEGKVILVPKILVRHRLGYDAGEYYRHYILPQMQWEHIQANSSLVQTLKSGEKKVTKKSLIEKYGSGKLALVEQTLPRRHVLDDYRSEKQRRPPEPLSHRHLLELEDIPSPDFTKLISKLEQVPTGRDAASEYENVIEDILSVLFYPSLCHPTKQDKIHAGRKRIDITYTNEARSGFFAWIAQHHPCAHVFVECKNYGKEVGNPEVDQIAGRFSPSRGKVGILICRKIENKELLMKRCRDTADDQRGFILPLDDDDLKALIKELVHSDEGFQNFSLLRKLWGQLVK